MRKLKVAGVALALGFASCATGCMSTPESGEIGVVRNGGPFDNKNIRGIIDNGSGNTWTGFFSGVHYYPVDTQQRFFRMKTCGQDDSGNAQACDGADAPGVTVPTSDGVEVTVEGIFYLNTVFNNSGAGADALKAFDTQFATRTFDGKHAYEGPEGWSAFLGAIVEPIVANNLRETVSGITCAELFSSCALVQNAGSQQDVEKLAGKNNQSNVARVQELVEQGLAQDLEETLRRGYFENIKFNLNSVEPPEKVRLAIDDAQAQFAQVSKAQARVQQAAAFAEANKKKQKGYNACPTCARIDQINALPRGLQALGGDTVLGIGR